MTVSSIFNVTTFAPIAKLYDSPVATVVRPFTSWSVYIPAGYAYVPEYDGFYSGTTRLADLSPYWITDEVPYIPIDISSDDQYIRNSDRLSVPNFFIGVLGTANIAKFQASYRVIINDEELHVYHIQPIRTDWAEIRVAAL